MKKNSEEDKVKRVLPIKIPSFLKPLILPLTIIPIWGCASSFNTTIDHWEIRRIQQMSNIDTGLPARKGKPHISVSYQYALQEPEIQKFKDTVINHFDTGIIDANFYETRHVLNTELMIPFLDHIASGIHLDISLGDISNPGISKTSILHKNILETSMYLRYSTNINKLSLGFKPELVFFGINYQYTEICNSIIKTKKGYHHLGLTFRASIFSRLAFANRFALFLGIQYKRQPYLKYDSRLQFESALGIYTGIGVTFLNQFFIEPYVALPFATNYTEHRSPPQAGLKITTALSFSGE